MKNALINYEIKTVGKSKNAPRIWFQGKQPQRAGFQAGNRYSVTKNKDKLTVTLSLDANGSRMVSRKLVKGTEQPIIDLNSWEILDIFNGMDKVRIITVQNTIYILPLASEVRKKERLDRLMHKLLNNEPLSMGSLSHGGGVLSMALHQGLEDGGVHSSLTFANEIRSDMVEQAMTHNPVWTDQTIALISPMQEVIFDEWTMNKIPKVDILEAGIPCTGASLSGRAKNNTSCAEAHQDVGHLVVSFLNFVAKVNPAIVVLENVPAYQNTSSMWIIRHQLRDLGYELHEIILDGKEFNALEHRKRMCLVAVSEGIEFDWVNLVKPVEIQRTLSEVLENIADDDSAWSEMGYLKDKEVRDQQAGKGFSMQIGTPESTKVGTIGTGYAKNRSTEIKIQHPTNPNLLRLLTPNEHAKCKGIPEILITDTSKTMAHELLGQSIIFDVFVSVGQLLGTTLKNIKEKFQMPMSMAVNW